MKIETSRNDVVEKFLGNHGQDTELVADIKRVIERLRSDPFGTSAVTCLQECKVNIGGKKVNLYRVNPEKISGLPLSKRAKPSRILFVVANGSLGVVDILKNHGDYEKAVRRFKGLKV